MSLTHKVIVNGVNINFFLKSFCLFDCFHLKYIQILILNFQCKDQQIVTVLSTQIYLKISFTP